MPAVYFMGHVEPRDTHLMMENLSSITERDIVSGHITTFTVAIADCVVSVECVVDEYQSDFVSNLYTRSLELARTAVNLISLKMGWSLAVDLDLFIDPDGSEENIMKRMDSAQGIFDAYDLDDIDKVFNQIACDVNLFMALDDLVSGIGAPRVVAVNCARALDGIKNLLAPGLKDKAAWKLLQETLNVDEEYLQLISKKSTNSRHGYHEYITDAEASELVERTWKVANRYLHYRLNQQKALPLDLFRQLTVAPTPQS